MKQKPWVFVPVLCTHDKTYVKQSNDTFYINSDTNRFYHALLRIQRFVFAIETKYQDKQYRLYKIYILNSATKKFYLICEHRKCIHVRWFSSCWQKMCISG